MSLKKLDNKVVLVTGGTGTIGSEVVKNLLCSGSKVVVYSRDQNKQFRMNYKHDSKRLEFKNGDICDKFILNRAMKGVDYVVHCAAAKHVPLCEKNSDTAIKVNIQGTRNVLEACQRWGVKKFLLLSTDKAVDPTCVMGATKFLAERLTREFANIFPCSVVRLGNVFASNGSVVPTFQDRIDHNLPLVVNNPMTTRYFITKKECGEFIVDRLAGMKGGETFIKKMKIMTIKQLADAMVPSPEYPIEYSTLTQGEKVKEDLITQSEIPRAYDEGEYIVINGTKISTRVINPKVEFFTNDEICEMLKEIK